MKYPLYFLTMASAMFLATSLIANSTAIADRPQDISYLCTNDRNQLSFNQSIVPLNQSTLKVLTWNAHKFADTQYFIDIKKLSQISDLIFVQEALHSSGWQNAFASHMSFDWSFHKSFCIDNQATGVLTGSRYPLITPRTILTTDTEPLSFTPKVSGISFIEFQNKKIMMINTHALNFNLGYDFENQIDQIIEMISQTNLPIIWAGDFNTWSPGRRSYLFNQAISQGLDPLIPKNDLRALQLDHILVRGFRSLNTKVLDQFKSSDHFPVMTELVLQ
jgi:endonuclease/exonuclease/phosphatase (EEP) superfamily protein YafD